ncbi:hypothetical protein BC936DRAFT_139637 [Jimgerdemannia flammicorona]|uniref:Uncharacterized protein n=1 Tax=Jimgerdemannia flammicorona TaxID=994334 RepID=A0A433B9I7_9FUNG|nr:hypothetical protein BC936DRAFT_139637 [Jimgerdemannia flammicorona]
MRPSATRSTPVRKKANLVGDDNPKTNAFGEERHDGIVTQKPKLGPNELKAEPAPKPVLRSSQTHLGQRKTQCLWREEAGTKGSSPTAPTFHGESFVEFAWRCPRDVMVRLDCVEQDGRRLAGLG